MSQVSSYSSGCGVIKVERELEFESLYAEGVFILFLGYVGGGVGLRL